MVFINNSNAPSTYPTQHGNPVQNTHGTNTHSKREDGGVVDAINPMKGGGAHVPNSGHSSTTTPGHHQYDSSSHSANPLSSNTHSTTHTSGATHGSTGAGLTGTSHATHGHRAEDGGVVDAINPSVGGGSHLPASGQTHSSTHTGAGGLTGSHSGQTHNSTHTGAGGLTGSHSTHGTHGQNVTGTRAGEVNPIGGHPVGANPSLGSSHGTHGTTGPSHTPIGGNSHTGAHNTTGGAGAHSGAHSGTGINDHQTKVPVGDKIKGTVETLVGKVTSNPAKVAEGEALKTGNHTHGAAAGVQNAVHNSSTTGSHHV